MRLLNPLSPTTFLVRNAGKTIPLVTVITLAVMLVQGIIALINSIPYSIEIMYSYTKAMLGVSPRGDTANTPKLVKQLTTNPPVPIEHILICRASGAQLQSIVGKWPFAVIALNSGDMSIYLKRQGTRSLTGRMPKSGEPESIISRPVATNLGLSIGDVMLGPEKDSAYSPRQVKVVGIAETDRWLMLTDFDYIAENHFPPVDLAILLTKDPALQRTFDIWAEKKLKGQRAQVFAYHLIEKETKEMFGTLYKILNAVIAILVLVITIMMGMLMNIYQSQRLVEFGLLQAIGHTKNALLKRVLTEAVLFISVGWIFGLGAAQLLLQGLKRNLMDPKGFGLNTGDIVAFYYTIPIPVSILLVAVATIVIRFRNFDPVAVVERRIV